MSQFLPETPQSAVQQTDFKPIVETPTLDGDIALMQRIFSAAVSNPSQIPTDFLAYLVDFIQTQRLNIPIGQVIGFLGFTPSIASQIVTDETTASTSYVDLTTVGPELDGIADGRYLFLFLAQAWNSTAGGGAVVSISYDGGSPVDADSAETFANDPESIMGFATQVLSGGGGHTVRMQYRADVAGTANFQRRKLLSIKYANL